jgi:hypothetical protein
MVAVTLALWLILPHVERGIVHLPYNGIVTVGFRKPFRRIPVCRADKPVKFRTVFREWAEIVGPAGERIAWTCR